MIYHVPPHQGNGLVHKRLTQQAERDKSCPYAVRIACLPEDILSVINHAPTDFIYLPDTNNNK